MLARQQEKDLKLKLASLQADYLDMLNRTTEVRAGARQDQNKGARNGARDRFMPVTVGCSGIGYSAPGE